VRAPLGVTFCPSAPLLHPLVGLGLDAEIGALRAACHQAVSDLLGDGPQTVVVLGARLVPSTYPSDSAGSFAGYGVSVSVGGPGPHVLPLSLTIGSWLLDEARWQGPRVLIEAGPAGELPEFDVQGSWSLFVIADGSATRTDKAPGSFHPQAEQFDTAVEAALASGEGGRLRAIDKGLGDDVRAAGVAAWHAAGRLVADERYVAAAPLATAPYGVGYFVGQWSGSAL
jgi:hypothetical protein